MADDDLPSLIIITTNDFIILIVIISQNALHCTELSQYDEIECATNALCITIMLMT